MRVRALPSLVLALALLGASACAPDATSSAVDLSDPYQLPSADFDTYQAVLADLKGTPVVVNIWASWCGPCRAEAPGLSTAAVAHAGEVQFLGVDILDDRTSARAFIEEFGWTYPSLFDQDGEIRDLLGYIGQPVTIFYDAEGNIVSEWTGPMPEAELEARIDDLTQEA